MPNRPQALMDAARDAIDFLVKGVIFREGCHIARPDPAPPCGRRPRSGSFLYPADGKAAQTACREVDSQQLFAQGDQRQGGDCAADMSFLHLWIFAAL